MLPRIGEKSLKKEVFQNSKELGEAAAAFCQVIINKAIDQNGSARIVLATGASQLDTIRSLIKADVDWNRVEVFNLDEYVGLPESHKASFRKYLNEEFVDHVDPKAVHLVDGEGDVETKIKKLSATLVERPVDLALIGIGENTHIAFNDPPADFETQEPYIIVKLDEACKRQQVREGWFDKIEDVPETAVTMSVNRIMESKVILSCVPFKVKAEAVKSTLENPVTNKIPATILKTHPDWTLFLDVDSASMLS